MGVKWSLIIISFIKNKTKTMRISSGFCDIQGFCTFYHPQPFDDNTYLTSLIQDV
jgi:hypothetical protein